MSYEKVFNTFAAICSEPFSILAEDDATMSEPNVPSENNDMQAPGIPTCIPSQCRQEPCFPQPLTPDIQFQPVPSTSGGTPSTPDIRPIPTTSSSMRSTHTSITPMTPRKIKMKKRLAFLASSNQKIKKAYHDIARARIKTPKRVLNQAIKRKMRILKSNDEQIRELKERPLGHTFSEAKQNFRRLKEAHTKMIMYQKQNIHTHIHIYIYIYICVCVCVCVCGRYGHDTKQLHHSCTACRRTANLPGMA